MRYLVPAGGTAAFLLLVMTLLLGNAQAVQAQEPPRAIGGLFETVTDDVATYPALLMLVAVLAATGAGALAAKQPDPWPLWPGLVRGLGDAAFLLAIIATFARLREAMEVIARIGAAITPVDVADGLARSIARLVVGAFVALVGLGGSAFVRLRLAGRTAS